MRCKNCNENMPDPEPQIVTKEVQVDRSDAHYWLRATMAVALVLIVLILCIWGTMIYSDATLRKAIDNPTIKLEMIEYDDAGRIVRKITR